MMLDFSQLLTDKIDTIVEQWVEAVRQDQEIESAQELTYKSLRNSLPRVLEAMATVLSQSEASDIETLVDSSLEHGIVRAEQGFDPAEVAREYRILRAVLFSVLEEGLLQGSPAEMLRAVRLIDTVIDEAIARCFSSYTNGRLQELEQLQTQLKLTNQELTRLVRSSKENLSQLAHELKTPLTAIIGYSELFLRQQRRDISMPESFANLEHIERVLRGGRQLIQLINDALEVSRYDAGQMKLQVESIDVVTLINGVAELVEPVTAAKSLSLSINCQLAPHSVLTDPLRLKQVIGNLLSNAVHYTDAGSVNLTCQVLSDEQWSISITDTGVGIEPEDQAQIFEPYFRVVNHRPSELTHGTGLGLAIVSRLVQLLQGKIEVESEPNQGSTFTVILPLQLKVRASAMVASSDTIDA